MTHNYASAILLSLMLGLSLYIFSSIAKENRVITSGDATWTKELNHWIGNLSAYVAEDPDAAQIKEHGMKWNGNFHVDWLRQPEWLDIYIDRYEVIQSTEINATLIEGYNAAWMDRIFNRIRYVDINRTLIEGDGATWIDRHLNRGVAWIGDFEMTWLGDFNATWIEESNATFIKSFGVTYLDKAPNASACMLQFRTCGIKALSYLILLWISAMGTYICAFSIMNYALWSTWQATFNSDWQGYSRSAVLPHLWEVCRFVFQDLLNWLGRPIQMSRAIQWRRPWASAASRESTGYELVSGTEREWMA